MRSAFVASRPVSIRDARLVRTPNARDQAVRRRRWALAWVTALSLGSAALGFVATPRHGAGGERTGPFSYFPTE